MGVSAYPSHGAAEWSPKLDAASVMRKRKTETLLTFSPAFRVSRVRDSDTVLCGNVFPILNAAVPFCWILTRRPRQRKGRRNFVPISYLGGCMQCGRELPDDDMVSISSIVHNSIPSMNGFFFRRRRRWAAVCNSHRPPRNQQTRLGMQVKTEQKQILGMNSGSIYLTVIKSKSWMKIHMFY